MMIALLIVLGIIVLFVLVGVLSCLRLSGLISQDEEKREVENDKNANRI
jgi:hypothetical protein